MPIKTEVIANPKAERIRRVAELAERKGRKRAGRFLVEGPQSVRELLTWHPDIVRDLYVEAIGTEPDAPFLTIRWRRWQARPCRPVPMSTR